MSETERFIEELDELIQDASCTLEEVADWVRRFGEALELSRQYSDAPR